MPFTYPSLSLLTKAAINGGALNPILLVNPHHPEYWGGIKEMPKVYVAEMICDWYARSTEFGTGLREWIDNVATEKFSFNKEDDIYKEIQNILNLLLDPNFSVYQEK
jgi:hypothetical protein